MAWLGIGLAWLGLMWRRLGTSISLQRTVFVFARAFFFHFRVRFRRWSGTPGMSASTRERPCLHGRPPTEARRSTPWQTLARRRCYGRSLTTKKPRSRRCGEKRNKSSLVTCFSGLSIHCGLCNCVRSYIEWEVASRDKFYGF